MARPLRSPLLREKPTKPVLVSRQQFILPAKAAQILRLHAYARQRPVKPADVAVIKSLIATGDFRQGTTLTLVASADVGQTFLVNGQTTLTAVSESPIGVWLTLETYHVQTMAEVDALYGTFDQHRRRSAAEILRAHTTLDALQWSRSNLGYLGAACTHLAFGFTTVTSPTAPLFHLWRNARLKQEMAVSWTPEMGKWLAVSQGKRLRSPLMRAAILGIILATYRHQPAQAQRFWQAVVTDSGLLAGQPAHTLVRWIQDHPARSMRPEQYARYIAAAWNYAWNNRSVRHLVNARTIEEPLRLEGTPHTGVRALTYLTTDGTVLQDPIPLEGARL